MYVSTAIMQADRSSVSELSDLPPEVRSLFRREQEIASIVYRNGLATARDVEVQLSDAVTNASVRSILNRLIAKGILVHQRCGARGTFVYGPALTASFAREIVLRQFAADYYGGSLTFLANEIGEFYAAPPSLRSLLDCYDRCPPAEVEALSPRMREIAAAVYRNGCATIADIRDSLVVPVSDCCVRTVMNRLASRGLVRKRPGSRHRELVYLPGLVSRQVRRLALWRLIELRFEGDVGTALRSMLQVERSARLS